MLFTAFRFGSYYLEVFKDEKIFNDHNKINFRGYLNLRDKCYYVWNGEVLHYQILNRIIMYNLIDGISSINDIPIWLVNLAYEDNDHILLTPAGGKNEGNNIWYPRIVNGEIEYYPEVLISKLQQKQNLTELLKYDFTFLYKDFPEIKEYLFLLKKERSYRKKETLNVFNSLSNL